MRLDFTIVNFARLLVDSASTISLEHKAEMEGRPPPPSSQPTTAVERGAATLEHAMAGGRDEPMYLPTVLSAEIYCQAPVSKKESQG